MTAVMGYPTKTAAVLAFRAEGKRWCDIARTLGISINAATGLASHATRVKSLQPVMPVQDGRDVNLLPLDVRQRLRPHAARRGISMDRLIADLLAAIADGNLVDAVLDDAGDAA